MFTSLAGMAGEAMSVLLAELIAEGGRVPLAPADYAPFYRSLLAGRVARPRRPAHPRLFIWGPLEARLQQPDVVILGSLNEGVWPRPQEASPWLSRPMAAKLGLPAPERRIGLSAHDSRRRLARRPSISPAPSRSTACRPCPRAGCNGSTRWSRRPS